ncbi:MlaD family protein [Gordonia sp. MP11Mi]|uniref:Mce family protein n=1 Tax=Gordonia sp. MP11Mi TaxID=3022769 RepID=A0AA97GUW9_9ACTN
MTEFRIPGMSATAGAYRNRALATIAAVAAVTTVTVVGVRALPDDTTEIILKTTSVAGGIGPDAAVVLNGSEVGVVSEIDVAAPDTYAVTLDLSGDRADDALAVLTDRTVVSYAPKNLFGISAVVLTSQSGGTPLHNGSTLDAGDPEDATMTTLLRKLSDIQNEAFDPYMSDILSVAAKATDGLLPILGVAGQIMNDIAETQVVSPRKTLPQFAQLVGQVRGTFDDLLPPIRRLMDWQAPRRPGFSEMAEQELAYTEGPVMDQVTKLFSDSELGQTAPLMPVITALLNRINNTFPDSRTNGIQIATLIEKLRRALPAGPDGSPVLTVDAVLASAPGLKAVLDQPPMTKRPATHPTRQGGTR